MARVAGRGCSEGAPECNKQDVQPAATVGAAGACCDPAPFPSPSHATPLYLPAPPAADSIETVMGAQWYDANISLPGCDKNMPGTVIAMARINRPSLMVYGGAPMRVLVLAGDGAADAAWRQA